MKTKFSQPNQKKVTLYPNGKPKSSLQQIIALYGDNTFNHPLMCKCVGCVSSITDSHNNTSMTNKQQDNDKNL